MLDAEADSTEAFVVTEPVEGRNLEEHVRATGPLSAPELARLAAGLRDVLEAVHAADVVHRDLKLSNVLVTPRGPVLIDFGIAQSADDVRVTSGNLVVGTPGYLAPELLADAEPSAVSDWWGWAAVLDAVLARSQAGDIDVVALGPLTAGALRAALDPDPTLRALPDDVVADLQDAAEHGDSPPPTEVLAPRAIAHEPATRVIGNDGSTRAFAAPPGGLVVDDDGYRDGDGYGYSAGSDRGHRGEGPEVVEPAYLASDPRRRTGSILALALLAGGAALCPGLSILVVLVALVLFRTVGSAVDALQARRVRRGGVGRTDAARAVAASPSHLLRALVGLVPSLLVGARVVVVVGGVLWWALGSDRLVVPSRGPPNASLKPSPGTPAD